MIYLESQRNGRQKGKPYWTEGNAVIGGAAQGVEMAFREYEGCFRAFDMMGAATGIGRDTRAFLLENFRSAQSRFFAENK